MLEVGPTQRPPLAPQRDSVALCWPEKKAEKKRTELAEVVVLFSYSKLNSLCHSPHLDIVCSGSGFTYVEVCLERVASPGLTVYTVVVAAASLSGQWFKVRPTE